jgi:hypothetical protein
MPVDLGQGGGDRLAHGDPGPLGGTPHPALAATQTGGSPQLGE